MERITRIETFVAKVYWRSVNITYDTNKNKTNKHLTAFYYNTRIGILIQMCHFMSNLNFKENVNGHTQ